MQALLMRISYSIRIRNFNGRQLGNLWRLPNRKDDLRKMDDDERSSWLKSKIDHCYWFTRLTNLIVVVIVVDSNCIVLVSDG